MATLFIHGVGNPYGDLFAERVKEIVAPRLRDALRRAGRPDEPHVRGVYWGSLPTAGIPAPPRPSAVDDATGLRMAVLNRLQSRLAEPDAQLTLIGLGLQVGVVSAALDEYLRWLTPGMRIDEALALPGEKLSDAVVEALRGNNAIAADAAPEDVAELRALLRQVAQSGAAQLGSLGRQPDLLVAVDALRVGGISLLGSLLGGLNEIQTYLGVGGEAIRATLAEAITAMRADYPREPLRIIGHSLGGVIAFDLLDNSPDFVPVDLLVTAGSQIGLLGQQGMLLGQLAPASQLAPLLLPPGVRRWLNVMDANDALAFGIGDVALVDGARVIDRVYSSGVGWPGSHSTYWNSPRFFDLLAQYYDQGEPSDET